MSSATSPAARPRLGVVLLTIFLDLVGFSIVFPLFPAMLEWYLPREGTDSLLGHLIQTLATLSPGPQADFRTTVLFGGILGSLYSLLQFAFSPYWGRLSDRLGRRPVLLMTTAGTLLAYLCWVFAGPFWVLLLARAVGGVMAGNISVATAAVADLTDARDRAKGMGLVGMAFGLGFIVGPALGSLAIHFDPTAHWPALASYGLHPFSGAALIAVVLAAVNWLWVRRSFVETLPAARRHPEHPPARRLLGWMTVNSAEVRHTVWVNFLFLFAFSGMEFTLTFLATERLDYGPQRMFVIFVFVGVVMALVQGYFVRKHGTRLGEVRMALAGFVSGLFGLMCLSFAIGPGLFYTGLFAMAVGIGLISPSLSALCSRYSPAQEQGANLGVFRASGSLGRAVGPILAALVYWRLGSGTCYHIGAGVLATAFLLALFLPPPPTVAQSETGTGSAS